MNTKTISNRALSVIDQYLHFKIGGAVCSVPYFNNKSVKARATFGVQVGKGSPQEIFEEMETIMFKSHIADDLLADESLKKLLVENNIGIDCSGFAYYVLNAESEERGQGSLGRHLHLVSAGNFLTRFVYMLHPENNTNVALLAHSRNSDAISLKDTQPGDMVTMLNNDDDGNERNHILIVHQVEYQNFLPTRIHYSHAVAYPEDGIYGSGIRQGFIEITDLSKQLTDGVWSESGSVDKAGRLFARAQKSKTELRRLRWF